MATYYGIKLTEREEIAEIAGREESKPFKLNYKYETTRINTLCKGKERTRLYQYDNQGRKRSIDLSCDAYFHDWE